MGFKYLLTVCAALGCVASNLSAQESSDSMRVENLQEIVVKGVRAQKNAPYAVANIKREQLTEFAKSGKELPFLFAQTPGVLAWSDNGLGTGSSYMRIRGAGDSRINVTLDGVPLNSPEDQCVFWANMNSYGALMGSVQIQRGVGTSTNGDGAFGGTVALSLAAPSQQTSSEVSFSYGSYNTLNIGAKGSTGLLWNHLIIDGAGYQTLTNGFMHGTAGRSGSYYGGITWQSDRFQIRYKNVGNYETTGQAWNGVTAGSDDLSLMDGTYGQSTGIKTYADLWKAGLGQYNSLYEYIVTNDAGEFVKDENGRYTTQRYKMSDGSLWPRTTDNFWQNHNILSAAWNINEHLTTSASLRYTYGYGYYEEFRYNNKLKKFGLTAINSDSSEIKKADFVRKKGLDQHTLGMVWNINYTDELWDIVGGAAAQNFTSNHFGHLTYTSNPIVQQKYLADGKHVYYDSDARKFDFNVFVKAAMHITEQWDVFADLQYRRVNYRTTGINDKFYDDASGYNNQVLDIDKHYNFFNPKAGFAWQLNEHRIYGSLAVSNREPERNNFTDNGKYPAPNPERLLDYELGYSFGGSLLNAGVNFYYMDYIDQFVQTGEQSDIGESLTTNIKDSYRAGVEIYAAVQAVRWLKLEANAALSTNKIKDFTEVVEDWDNGIQNIRYGNSTLAFSPSAIVNGFINFQHKAWQATWHTAFVSRQYLDNTQNLQRSLPAYSVSNLSASYSFAIPLLRVKELVLGVNLNNVFNQRFATSGWVYSAICESAGHTNDNRYYQIGFVPMAGFTAMGSLTIKF
ncbi:MAG: TonB-dependent receptor [Bacteroidales bacterium]|nr:TonB-dependent receptor [Bacteroidales bacterium]